MHLSHYNSYKNIIGLTLFKPSIYSRYVFCAAHYTLIFYKIINIYLLQSSNTIVRYDFCSVYRNEFKFAPYSIEILMHTLNLFQDRTQCYVPYAYITYNY